jgi:hypothetical protein
MFTECNEMTRSSKDCLSARAARSSINAIAKETKAQIIKAEAKTADGRW